MDDTKKYELSDLDKMGFTKTVKLAIFYKLDAIINPEELISSMIEGVKNATCHMSFMAGNLQFDATGKLCSVVPPGSEIKLNIQQFGFTKSNSLSAIAKASFSPNNLDLTPFLPGDAAPGTFPACALQFSFIEGGLVLGFRFNHAIGDWSSMDTFLSFLCQSIKAHQEGLEPPSYTPDLNRTPYNTPPLDPNISQQTHLEKLPIFYVLEKSQLKPLPPPPATRAALFKVSEASLAQVKTSCTPYLNGVDYITSYDCISALLWTATTRARLHLHPDKATTPCRLVHPIDMRLRDPLYKTSKSYFGNAVIGSVAGPVPAQTLIPEGYETLANAASLIRQSINKIDISTAGHMTSLLASLTPAETLGSNVDFVDMDMYMNTWFSGKAEKYEIGAGAVPVAVRLPVPVPGASVILPNFSRGGKRVFDIIAQLPAEEHDLLREDKELLKYFELVA